MSRSKKDVLADLAVLSVEDLEALADVALDAIATSHGILRRNINGKLERLDPSYVQFTFKAKR